MHRIDTSTATNALPAPAGPGPVPNGYFQPGNPQNGTQATNFDQDWCNMVQEELGAFLDAASIARVKGTFNQALASSKLLFGRHGCCRISVASATQLKLSPYNGNGIVINGLSEPVPAAGITATINNNSAFVNGVANQNLAASTVYYVYVFMNAGAMAIDFWAGANAVHITDTSAGNIGTEVRSNAGAPDSTRTLVGLIQTTAGSQLSDTAASRLCINWFNRRAIEVTGASTNSATTTSLSNVELNTAARVSFLTWADEAVFFVAPGWSSNSTAGDVCTTSCSFDGGGGTTNGTTATSGAAGQQQPTAATSAIFLTEGAHFGTVAGSVGGGTGTFSALLQGIIRG